MSNSHSRNYVSKYMLHEIDFYRPTSNNSQYYRQDFFTLARSILSMLTTNPDRDYMAGIHMNRSINLKMDPELFNLITAETELFSIPLYTGRNNLKNEDLIRDLTEGVYLKRIHVERFSAYLESLFTDELLYRSGGHPWENRIEPLYDAIFLSKDERQEE